MISILIRNKNEAIALENALMSIQQQKFTVPYEIVMIDDNSSDNSVEVAKKYNCKVVPLDRKFTYGYAINFGVTHCRYDIILLLSSHNILLSTDFSEKLVRYFQDENVAAVRCTPIANRGQILQSLKSLLVFSQENYNQATDWKHLITANCSAIRKRVALDTPFNETIRSNEEKLWSLDVMKKGYSIISNANCYFLYDKKNSAAAQTRDFISKYQIDGIKPLSIGRYSVNTLKSIPRSFRIGAIKWYTNLKISTQTVLIPFKYKKGLYK